jgi:hypothetical protein
MTVGVFTTPQADNQILAMDRWWRKERPAAPNLSQRNWQLRSSSLRQSLKRGGDTDTHLYPRSGVYFFGRLGTPLLQASRGIRHGSRRVERGAGERPWVVGDSGLPLPALSDDLERIGMPGIQAIHDCRN